MLKTHWRIISRIERVLDNLIVVVAFYASYHLRDDVLQMIPVLQASFADGLQKLGTLEDYLVILGCSLPLFNAVLSILGAYNSMRFSSYWRILRISIFAGALVFLLQGSVLYILKLDLSRSFLAVFVCLSSVGILLLRINVLLLLRFFRLRGKNFRNILIFGTGAQARKIHQEVVKNPEHGVRVVGFVAEEDSFRERSKVYDLAARVVATPETFEKALKRHAVDEVVFTDITPYISSVQELAVIAAEEGVRVTLAADFFSLQIVRSEVSFVGSIPLVHYHLSPAASESGALLLKRCIDIVVSSFALILLAPLLLAVAIAIRLESPGPILYRQRRVGLNGRTFVLLKFRSMIDGAERLLDSLRSQNEMSGPAFKLRKDPRVTSVGRFIRKYSIDELPQLLNVLRGDMSLVGPRPPIPEEVDSYLRTQRRRLSMRPGLTCTWQVSGRNEIPDFEQWAKLDLEYIDSWSLWNDFKLLLRTIPAVLFGVGAR